MPERSEEKRDFTNRDRWITVAFILGLWSALMDQMVAYSLNPTACENGTKLLLHATTAVFLVLSLTAGAIAWRVYVSIDRAPITVSEQRVRWVAIAAMALSLFGTVVILAMEIPNLILGSCD